MGGARARNVERAGIEPATSGLQSHAIARRRRAERDRDLVVEPNPVASEDAAGRRWTVFADTALTREWHLVSALRSTELPLGA
jgi:hypothetical protein